MSKIVLMYHDVYEKNPIESGFNSPGANHYKISKEVFTKHVRIISQYCESKGIDKENIVLTFDDGGVSFYTIIAPILEEYGWRGIFFISTKLVGTNEFLSQEQILELCKRGHIIGAHSHSHKVLTDISLEDVKYELSTNKDYLEAILGRPIETISIPNGSYSDDVLKITIEAGFQSIYTSKPSTQIKTFHGKELIGRYAILHNTQADDVIKIISSTTLRNWMRYRYEILKLARQALGQYYYKIRTTILRYSVNYKY